MGGMLLVMIKWVVVVVDGMVWPCRVGWGVLYRQSLLLLCTPSGDHRYCTSHVPITYLPLPWYPVLHRW